MKKTGKNLTDLLDSNRSQLLYHLIDHPGCSRADLGAASGLTLASITKIMNSLLEAGIVYETGFGKGKKGRRSVGLSFCYDKIKVLAVHMSWNQLEIRPYDLLGNAYGELISIPFPHISIENIEEVIHAAGDGIQKFCEEYPEIAAIGMAIPGPYFRDSGSILLPPYDRDPAKRCYYPVKEKLSQLTDRPVFLEHDADVAALAYWWFRTDRDPDFVIMNFLAHTGVGVGLTDGRRVFTGTSNCSCESGHITIDYNGRPCPYCGSNGCLNAYCSDRALEELAAEQLPDHPESRLYGRSSIICRDILEAAREGDSFATDLLTECGRHLGHGIISLLHVFNPDLILISGSICEAGAPLMNGIQESLGKRRSNYITIPEIRLLSDEKELPLLGAATFAMDRMLNAPTRYFSLPANN